MSHDYDVAICRELAARFDACALARPLRVERYDPGTVLEYTLRGVDAATSGTTAPATLTVERFVGGGFAGQVYRVRLDRLAAPSFGSLREGDDYALKILIPPSGFSLLFRNLLYAIGFQGAFQLQTNPEAALSGALWQKYIRRGAALALGDEQSVNNVHAILVDSTLGSCGELSDWVDGRTWRLEVDNRMDALARWEHGRAVPPGLLGSPEYRAKKEYMRRFTALLNEMGAHEFARQYEWSTWKSQPNCLKRSSSGDDPAGGLTAVDFRAGLVLLPFLPMSPGDVALIGRGVLRGSLVQFDRGDLRRLRSYVERHREGFADLLPLFEPLERCERAYRNSVPDITHHHVRLLCSPALWRGVMRAAVTGWRVQNHIDDDHEQWLRRSPFMVLLLMSAGIVPFFGRVLLRMCAHTGWRAHYLSLLRPPYLLRALRGVIAERSIAWYRSGRVDAATARRCSTNPVVGVLHMVLSPLPVGMHRFLTDAQAFRALFSSLLVRPVRLYFDAALREQWLRDMVAQGRKKHIISDVDAATILDSLSEPYIQKYLKCLAVHVCTAPITQVVSVAIAALFWFTHPDMPAAERSLAAAAILAAFQVVPLSPGSLIRGLYVLFIVIRERNIRDYSIALFLGFFKYVGYLAFPIQMAYRYPELARFMAVHWATEAVHVVPVFGEHGALLERRVFELFYNWPLTIGRRVGDRIRRRAPLVTNWWQFPVLALMGAGVAAGSEVLHARAGLPRPALGDIWYLVVAIPATVGILGTVLAGGLVIWKRIAACAGSAVAAALLYGLLWGGFVQGWTPHVPDLISRTVWCVFIFGLVATAAALMTEVLWPDPQMREG